MTLEELERRAYADGDVTLTRLLQAAQDEAEDMIERNSWESAERAYDDGYEAGLRAAE